MHMRMIVPIALFAGGAACIAAAVATGEADVSLFLIFPVFTGSSGLFLLGTAFIVFSLITGFLFMVMGQLELATPVQTTGRDNEGPGPSPRDRRYGGVVLIGPVPIAFGSDSKIALAMLVIGIIVAIVALTMIVLFL